MKKAAALILLLVFLVSSFGFNVGTAAEQPVGAIRVPATMVWINPGQLRDYDSLILAEDNNPLAWADGMDTTMRQWLVGKVETMLLFGERVVILDEQDGWLKIASIGHRTVKNERGYPGWIPASHVEINNNYLENLVALPSVTVSAKFAFVYADEYASVKLNEVSHMVTLPLLEEYESTVAVSLPDGGVGYLSKEDVRTADEIRFTQSGIVEEALKFLDRRYIWAGTGAYGFDCSGFTFRLYQSQGIDIPRDAWEQANEGTAIHKRNIEPGDLVFYARRNSRIHHVGMYIGNGMMIHSPDSSSAVRIDSIERGDYSRNIAGFRRYGVESEPVDEPQDPEEPTEPVDEEPGETPRGNAGNWQGNGNGNNR